MGHRCGARCDGYTNGRICERELKTNGQKKSLCETFVVDLFSPKVEIRLSEYCVPEMQDSFGWIGRGKFEDFGEDKNTQKDSRWDGEETMSVLATQLEWAEAFALIPSLAWVPVFLGAFFFQLYYSARAQESGRKKVRQMVGEPTRVRLSDCRETERWQDAEVKRRESWKAQLLL